MPPYNILLITSDDQNWQAIESTHIAPGMTVAMPRVCADLIGHGVKFSNAFISSPLCAPSRASFLTGQYAHNHGVIHTSGPQGFAEGFDASSTMFTWAHAADYRTSMIGKYGNDYFENSPTIPPGVDDFCAFLKNNYYNYDMNDNGTIMHHGSSEVDYSTDVVAARAQAFIADATGGAPWFMWLCPYAPHVDASTGFPTPALRHIGAFSGVPPWRPLNWNEPDVDDKAPWLRALPQLDAAKIAKIDASRQAALEACLAVDEMVGALVDQLEALGILDETIVIYVGGDNGYQWGTHRLYAKCAPYEEAIRSTFIVRHPDFPTPRVDDRIVSNIDIAPTIAEICGATPTLSPINGVSMVPLLDGGGTAHPDILIEHVDEHTNPRQDPPTYQGVRNATRKLIKYQDPAQGMELYDLGDPYERQNKASDPAYAADKAALLTRLAELKAE